MADQTTLAKMIKERFPGEYDDYPDAVLEKMVIDKYPGEYDDYPMTKAAAEAPAKPAEPPAKPKGVVRGVMSTAGDVAKATGNALFSRTETGHAIGRSLASTIEGVERPDEPRVGAADAMIQAVKEAPLKTAGTMLFGLTGVPSIAEYLKETAGAVKDSWERTMPYSPAARVAAGLPAEPTVMEKLKWRLGTGIDQSRAYAGGVTQGVFDMSPVDVATTVAGMPKERIKITIPKGGGAATSSVVRGTVGGYLADRALGKAASVVDKARIARSVPGERTVVPSEVSYTPGEGDGKYLNRASRAATEFIDYLRGKQAPEVTDPTDVRSALVESQPGISTPIKDLDPNLTLEQHRAMGDKVYADMESARRLPNDVTPVLRKNGELIPSRPGPATDRAVSAAIQEAIDVKAAIAKRANRYGKLKGSIQKVSDALTDVLDKARINTGPDSVELPPSDEPPMPKVGGRQESATGVTQPDPGGGLGHVKASGYKGGTPEKLAATGRTRIDTIFEGHDSKRSIFDNLIEHYLKTGDEESLKSAQTIFRETEILGRPERLARLRQQEIDRVAAEVGGRKKTRAAAAADIPLPGQPAVPVRTETTAEQRAAARSAAQETPGVNQITGAVPAAAGSGPVTSPIRAVSGNGKQYTQTEVAALRTSAIQKLKQLKLNPKSTLISPRNRFIHLASKEGELTAAEVTEMAKLFGRITEHADLPVKLKKSIINAQRMQEQIDIRLARRAETPAAEAIAPTPATVTPEPVPAAAEAPVTSPEAAPAAAAESVPAAAAVPEVTGAGAAPAPRDVGAAARTAYGEALLQGPEAHALGESIRQALPAGRAAENPLMPRIAATAAVNPEVGRAVEDALARARGNPDVQAILQAVADEMGLTESGMVVGPEDVPAGGIGRQPREMLSRTGGAPPERLSPANILQWAAGRAGLKGERGVRFAPGFENRMPESPVAAAGRAQREQFFPRDRNARAENMDKIRAEREANSQERTGQKKRTAAEEKALRKKQAREAGAGTTAATAAPVSRERTLPISEDPWHQANAAAGKRRGPMADPAAVEAQRQAQAAIAESAEAAPSATEHRVLEKVPEDRQGDLRQTMHDLADAIREEVSTHGVKDPERIDTLRRYFGAVKTARMLGMKADEVRALTGASGGIPTEATERILEAKFKQAINDPKGFSNTGLLSVTAGTLLGGALGGALGDDDTDPMDRVAMALAGSAMGAGMAGLAHSAIKNYSWDSAKSATEAADSVNLLTGPAMIKSSLGSVGGAGYGIFEAYKTGNKTGARRAMRYLMRQAPGDYIREFRKPTNFNRLGAFSGQVARSEGVYKLPHKILDKVLRPFNAADAVGKKAMALAGYTEAEADRIMLLGTPTSELGQSVLNTINKYWATRMLAKFARVRISTLERGIEFTPGLNRVWNTRTRRGTLGRFKPQEALSSKQLRARAQFGAGAMAAGGLYGYLRDPGKTEMGTTAAAVGPAALPFTLATIAGKGLRHNQVPIRDIAGAIADTVPKIDEADIANIFKLDRFRLLHSGRTFVNRLFGEEE